MKPKRQWIKGLYQLVLLFYLRDIVAAAALLSRWSLAFVETKHGHQRIKQMHQSSKRLRSERQIAMTLRACTRKVMRDLKHSLEGLSGFSEATHKEAAATRTLGRDLWKQEPIRGRVRKWTTRLDKPTGSADNSTGHRTCENDGAPSRRNKQIRSRRGDPLQSTKSGKWSHQMVSATKISTQIRR